MAHAHKLLVHACERVPHGAQLSALQVVPDSRPFVLPSANDNLHGRQLGREILAAPQQKVRIVAALSVRAHILSVCAHIRYASACAYALPV